MHTCIVLYCNNTVTDLSFFRFCLIQLLCLESNYLRYALCLRFPGGKDSLLADVPLTPCMRVVVVRDLLEGTDIFKNL